MFDFFKQVGEIFSAIIDFVVMLVEGLVNMIVMIPRGMGYLMSTILLSPSVILPFVTIGITTSIILFIIGRQGAK